MSVKGCRTKVEPAHDVLVNVNALGEVVPSARFMGGRAFDMIRSGHSAESTGCDRAHVLANRTMLMPSVKQSAGPFHGCTMHWQGPPDNDGQRMAALSFYLALMTNYCLDLIGAEGPLIIEGPFTRNKAYLDMLASIRPAGVFVAASSTGTSVGAALLFTNHVPDVQNRKIAIPEDFAALSSYASAWNLNIS